MTGTKKKMCKFRRKMDKSPQLKGGQHHFSRIFQFFFVAVITFFSLSSVQIIFIPACCLLCVL